MKYREIEFKYNASDISLKDFNKFCKDRKPEKFIEVGGYDYFYKTTGNNGGFCRHRVGADSNQLTFKRKTTSGNNFIRTEHNIDLVNLVSVDQIAALCKEFGYEPAAALFKNCFIYVYDFYILVYYIVYDTGMKELGRFVEIEMKEDHTWTSETEAWDALTAMERICKPLGLSSQARIRKSLFEMFGG